jgi:hypothetical protein
MQFWTGSMMSCIIGDQPSLILLVAVTNARFAALHGLPVAPVPLSTTPVPLRKSRARHELAWCIGRKSGGLPSAARRRALRSGRDSLNASLRLRSTLPARRPQTEARSKPYRRIQKDRPSGSGARSAYEPKLVGSESIPRLPRSEYTGHSHPLFQPIFPE